MLAMGHPAHGVFWELSVSAIKAGAAGAPGAFYHGLGWDVLCAVPAQHHSPSQPSLAPGH